MTEVVSVIRELNMLEWWMLRRSLRGTGPFYRGLWTVIAPGKASIPITKNELRTVTQMT